MKKFELSKDCILKKSSNAVAKELLKGAFVIGCDFKNKQLVLENVFHYTDSEKRLEVYTLFPNKDDTKRQLKLETAFVLINQCDDILNAIIDILDIGINGYDILLIDKYQNLYTETVFGKYGRNMRLA